MTVYANEIEVVQAALHRMGEESISSLDDNSTAAKVAQSNYEGIIRGYLTRHAWTFAKRTLPLTYQGVVDLGPWEFAYVIPTEALNVRWVQRAGGGKLRSADYAIEGGRVLTRADGDLQIVATTRVNESEWPADFAEAVVVRLQGLFIESLADKPQDARLKIRDAEGLMRECITRDKRQEPGAVVEFVPLVEAWRSRGRRAARAELNG